MNIKASGRAALMVAATIWLWCAGPLHAQETTEAAPPAAAQQATVPNPLQQLFGINPAPAATEPPATEPPGRPIVLNKYRKTSARHGRRHQASRTHRHSRKAAAEDKAAAQARAEANKPETVADADNAAPPAFAPATPNDASPAAQPGNTAAEAHDIDAGTETGVVAADELNEVDRAITAQAAAPAAEPAPTLALASVTPPEPVTTGQAASAGDDTSSWARASLIGKIFIGFGGLLMLGSAVRMLIA